MKKLLTFAAIAFLISSCDVIDRPYGEDVTGPGILPDVPRRVLLEEFTGYRCANCPPAADFMKLLKKNNSPRVELLTVHYGGFAEPIGSYENEVELRSETAKEVHDLLGISSYPRIGVSREIIGGQRAVSAGKMETAMKELLFEGGDETAAPLLADMDVWTNASVSGNTVTLSSDVFYVKDSDPDNHIVHYIIEDSIVGAQLDSRKKPDNFIRDYIHTNTLRGAVNGFFGEKVSPDVVPAGDTVFTTSSYTIPSAEWQKDQLYILTLITDNSGGEVLQLYKTKVVQE